MYLNIKPDQIPLFAAILRTQALELNWDAAQAGPDGRIPILVRYVSFRDWRPITRAELLEALEALDRVCIWGVA